MNSTKELGFNKELIDKHSDLFDTIQVNIEGYIYEIPVDVVKKCPVKSIHGYEPQYFVHKDKFNIHKY